MSIIKTIKKQSIKIGPKWFGRFLSIYPPFLFFGLKIRFTNEFKTCKLQLPFRWYLKNGNGSMFGGAILAVSDPFPAIMLSRSIPWAITWTMQHEVIFKKPVTGSIIAEITIEDKELETIKIHLKKDKKFIKTYSYLFFNDKNEEVAEVKSTIYMKIP